MDMTLFEECKELLKADFDVVERDDLSMVMDIFHRNLPGSDYEKILLMNTLVFRGDYRGLSTPTAESNKLCGVVVP
ncbi:hypothetical protein DZA29_13560 [Citrobacter gillenii]|nr:hypothetical protein DZA29_13560 [Citrobacter gillenii]